MSITLKPLRVGFGDILFDYTPDQLAVMQGGLAQTLSQQGIMPCGPMTVQAAVGRRANLRANEFVLQGENRWRRYWCNAGL